MKDLTVNQWLGRIAVMCRTITKQGRYHVNCSYAAHVDAMDVHYCHADTNYMPDADGCYHYDRFVICGLLQCDKDGAADKLAAVYDELLALVEGDDINNFYDGE